MEHIEEVTNEDISDTVSESSFVSDTGGVGAGDLVSYEDEEDKEEEDLESLILSPEHEELLESAISSYRFFACKTVETVHLELKKSGCTLVTKLRLFNWFSTREDNGSESDRWAFRAEKLKKVDHAVGEKEKVSSKVRFLEEIASIREFNCDTSTGGYVKCSDTVSEISMDGDTVNAGRFSGLEIGVLDGDYTADEISAAIKFLHKHMLDKEDKEGLPYNLLTQDEIITAIKKRREIVSKLESEKVGEDEVKSPMVTTDIIEGLEDMVDDLHHCDINLTIPPKSPMVVPGVAELERTNEVDTGGGGNGGF